jgi:hypothetical protein
MTRDMVRRPTQRTHPQASETKLSKEGAVNIGEKLTSRQKKSDASPIIELPFLFLFFFRKGILFCGSSQKNGKMDHGGFIDRWSKNVETLA